MQRLSDGFERPQAEQIQVQKQHEQQNEVERLVRRLQSCVAVGMIRGQVGGAAECRLKLAQPTCHMQGDAAVSRRAGHTCTANPEQANWHIHKQMMRSQIV